MKVFVLEGHYDWDGFDIVGIFFSEVSAEAFIPQVKRRRRYDDFHISEYEVQE